MMIGIDIDDVLVNTNGGPNGLMMRAWEKLGRSDEFVPTIDWECSNWPANIWDEYEKLLMSDALFDAGLCDDRIPDALRQTAHDYIFITARAPECFDKTAQQLRRCGIPFDPETQLFCTGDGTLYGSKISILKKHNVALMIDDGLHNIQACLDNGIDTVLISNAMTTWNHSGRGDMSYADNLVDVLESLK